MAAATGRRCWPADRAVTRATLLLAPPWRPIDAIRALLRPRG
ncbi:MAG: hypothetical protein V4472_04575 [Pseudomonadota bacterium]